LKKQNKGKNREKKKGVTPATPLETNARTIISSPRKRGKKGGGEEEEGTRIKCGKRK